MEPVVNGLEETFQNEVEFRSIDVNTSEGKKAFQVYALPGHPSYIILNPAGEVLWRGFGEQPGADLATQVESILQEK